MADEVVVMQDGRVVESGPADRIFDRPETAYTRALIAAAFNLAVADTGVVRE
jgi:microcin C transport system ATP-binding protein